MKSGRSVAVSILAIAVGLAIGYLDSRSTLHDAQLTGIALAATSFVFSAASPRVAWFVGLAVGAPVVVFNYLLSGGYGSLIALGYSAVGAAAGYGIGRALFGVGR